MRWWPRRARLAEVPGQVVFPDMLRRCQQVREDVQRLCAEAIALQAQMVQLEVRLAGIKESPAVSAPETFTYERRQRDA